MYFSQPDGVRTHFDVWDLNLPRDIYFLHGNLASNRWWHPLFAHLPIGTGKGRAIAVEWRGCGLSDAPRNETELHPQALGNDLLRLIAHLSPKDSPVDVVGHSTGGIISACAASEHREAMAHLVLIDSVGPRGVQFEPEFLKTIDAMRTHRDICASGLLGTVYGVDTKTSFYDRLVDDAMRMAKPNWRGVVGQLNGVNFEKEFRSIKAQTSILHGEFDFICPRQGAELYRELIPNAALEILPGRGHCPIVEDPALVATHLKAFLEL